MYSIRPFYVFSVLGYLFALAKLRLICYLLSLRQFSNEEKFASTHIFPSPFVHFNLLFADVDGQTGTICCTRRGHRARQ